MRRIPLRTASAVALAVTLAIAGRSPLGAQRPDTAVADTFRLRRLVVTATRVAMPASSVPAATTVIDRDEIEKSGAKHLVEVLRAVPGATLVQTGPYGAAASLFMRGGESDYVKVLVDGVPVNQPGGAIDLSTLTLDDVERVEVVRGPVSVLYGSDAMSGVVQIFTRRGRGTSRFRAEAKGGNYGTWETAVSTSGGDEGLAYSASLSRFASDGTYAFNNEYRNDVAAARVDASPDSRTEARVTFRWSDSEYHYPTDGAGNVVDRNTFQTGTRIVAAAEVGRRLTPWLDARLLFSGADLRTGLTDRPDGPSDTLGVFGYLGSGRARRRTAELRGTATLGAAAFTAGASLERERELSQGTAQTAFGDFPAAYSGDRTDRAYYGELILRPVSRITWTGGVRLDDDDAFGHFTTYRAGVSLHVLNGTRLRAALGTAFKEPTILENFGVGFARGNPDLRPERSRSWEIGGDETLLGGRLQIGATWFDQRFRDMIDYNAAPPAADGPNYYNIAGASARGLELGVRVVVTDDLALVAGYTRLATETTDTSFVSGPDALFAPGAPLLRRPANAGRMGLDATLGAGAAASLFLSRTGARWDLDYSVYPAVRVRLAPYTRVDASATLPIHIGHGPGLTAMLRVENALDADYQEVLGFPARGRTVLVGGTVEIGR